MESCNIPNCGVCGNNTFNLESGSYFCTECNTKSQDVHEEVFDEFFGSQTAKAKLLGKNTKKKQNLDQDKSFTSWEVLNYILKGITDELLAQGAKKEIKIVTLQLWVSYLKKSNVAFTSVNIERKPKLGLPFKPSDAEIIYGVTKKDVNEKGWHLRSRPPSNVSNVSRMSVETENTGSRRSNLLRLHTRKKALASAEYSQMSNNVTVSESQTLETLGINDCADKPQRIKLTKKAKEMLASCEFGTDDGKNVRRKLKRKGILSVSNITVGKIGALSNIALALTGQDIQVSDFLRWVEEGHISLEDSKKFIPEDAIFKNDIQKMLNLGKLSYFSCQSYMADICNDLNITGLPVPDLGRLITRYCQELQLPDELIGLAYKVMIIASNKEEHYIPSMEKSYEAQAMATIVVALKLLFSLDDCTEYVLSHTASELNKVHKYQSFVFSDWVKFIECRKAVVSTYHLPTRNSVYGNTMGRDSELFVQHYSPILDNEQSNFNEISSRYALNKTWIEEMVKCLHKLSSDQSENQSSKPIQFPATLTPLHTYCQVLLTQHSEQVAAAAHILHNNFPSHSLQYILSPDQTIAVGLFNDLHISKRKEGVADTVQFKEMVLEVPISSAIPRRNINKTSISVKILTDNEVSQSDNTAKRTFLDSFRDIISDNSEESDCDDEMDDESSKCVIPSNCHTELDLFTTGAQYWHIDISLTKNKINHEEFDTFAIKTFPSSFYWLLKECSRIVYVPMKVLYSHILLTEKKINSSFNSRVLPKKRI